VQAPGSFSPPPPTQTDAICWEANVVTFNNTNVFGSKNVANLPTSFQNGWVSMNFLGGTVPAGKHQLIGGASTVFNTAAGTTSALTSTTFNGLPVIGFSAITFENGVIPNGGGLIQSQYGGSFNHKQTRSIQ
jgi:flagellin-like hook-associated protein FlgL